jgi:hypothetical protein
VYSFPADIFSLGLVFFELYEKKLPDYNAQIGRVVLPPQFKSASLGIRLSSFSFWLFLFVCFSFSVELVL